MILKDLVVTGICKLLRNATVSELVVEAINNVTKEEIDTLQGVTQNIPTQISAINSELEIAKVTQTTFKSGIADAINNIPRNPNTEQLTSDSDLSQFVNELGEIEHGPDVSTVNATAEQVVKGYRFVNNKWEVVEGNLVDYGYEPEADSVAFWNNNLYMYIPENSNHPTEQNRGVITRSIWRPLSDFGDAETADVVYPATFTSKVALKALGVLKDRINDPTDDGDTDSGQLRCVSVGYNDDTYGGEGAIYLRMPVGAYRRAAHGTTVNVSDDTYWEAVCKYSDLMDGAGYTADMIKYGQVMFGVPGMFTFDATATADQILSGKTAYVAGSKVTGTIKDYPDYTKASTAGDITRSSYYNSSGNIVSCVSKKFIYLRHGRTGHVASRSRDLIYEASNFGNATAADVVSGKTFTSAAGFKVTGTGSQGLEYTSFSEAYNAEPNCSFVDQCEIYDLIYPYISPDKSIEDVVGVIVYISGSYMVYDTYYPDDGPSAGMMCPDPDNYKILADSAAVLLTKNHTDRNLVKSVGLMVYCNWTDDSISIEFSPSSYEYFGPAGNGDNCHVVVTYLYK